jgi:hypothetical protein
MDYVEAEVWVCVDANDSYTVASDPDSLDAPDAGVPSRVVKITVKVPRPKAAALVAVVAEEPTGGEVTAAE